MENDYETERKRPEYEKTGQTLRQRQYGCESSWVRNQRGKKKATSWDKMEEKKICEEDES